MTEAAFSVAVVAEARADKQIACELAERVLVRDVEWIEHVGLSDLVRWRGLEASMEFLAWQAVMKAARARRITVHGKFRTAPGVFDERRGRLALLLFNCLPRQPDAILMVRDTDGDVRHIESLERVRDSTKWRYPVILATPHPNRECWVLAGFDPAETKEKKALEDVRSELGFDPRLRADRLTARGIKSKRNAKRVLAKLMRPASEREERCWRKTDLGLLVKRGKDSGLAAYLDEVAERLVPVLAGSARMG